MTELKIAKDLALPLDAVTQKLAWLGRTGSGKTYGAKRMVEQMIRAGAQVVILDPVGVWAGLRLGPKALDVPVLGGLFGDIPLEANAATGAIVADLVVDHGSSIVLDLSQFLDGPRTRFATAFAERFFARKKAEPAAVHLVIEECQEFVPQNHQPGEEKMLHEFQRIAKLGRNFGIGVSLISQRPQEVNKKVLNQSECVFAFQLTGPHERKALEYWLSDKGGDGAKLGDLLPKLEIGAPHVWSPQWLKISKVVKILPIDTLDTSQTPKVGDKAFTQRKLEPIDLGALTTAMAATIEKAQADDPEALKKRIAELEKGASKPADPVRVEVPVFDQATFVAMTERLLDTMRTAFLTELDTLQQQAKKEPWQTERWHIGNAAYQKRVKTIAASREVMGNPEPRPAIVNRDTKPENMGDHLPKVERLILTALAQHQGRELTRQRLALLVGYHANAKSFTNGLGALRGRGAVQGLMITDAGLKELGRYERLPAGAALLEWYCQHKLSGVEARIAHAIRDGRGKLGREELAQKLDYHPNSKSFVNGIGRLRGLGIVDGLRLAGGMS